MPYQRRAHLELPDQQLALDDADAGWICTELDLGFPEIRPVTDNYPDNHGTIDRTKLFGARVVSAKMLAISGHTALDEVVAQFAPYLNPENRPTLHYTTEGNQRERSFPLRVSGFSSPMIVPVNRPFQMTWVAPDPFAISSEVSKVTAFAGSAVAGGRAYPLAYQRSYPGGTSVPTTGLIRSFGDVPVYPYLRVYGPIEHPVVSFTTSLSGRPFKIGFTTPTRIDAGHFIGVDTREHTAFLDDDPAQPMLSALDWTTLIWPQCPPSPDTTMMTITGLYATNVTQVEASWQDRYLT